MPFKPGQSGNPAGRRKGSVSLTTRLNKMLARADGTLARDLIAATIHDAIAHDGQSRKIVWERTDGRVPAAPEELAERFQKAYIEPRIEDLRGLPTPAIEAEQPIEGEFEAEG